MDKLISVIVPCYNVEKYIEKCIESITNQKYRNLEIIAIDDCSTDGTYNVLQKLAGKIDNLKVYKNEENKGAGFTRNFGVELSKAEWISFIDSDDYIEADFYQYMIGKIDDNVEVIICDIITSTGVLHSYKEKNTKKDIVNTGLAASPCNKIIKKELFLQYPFIEGKMNEDIASIIPIIINSKKIEYVSEVRYNYVQRSNSMQNSKVEHKRFDVFDSVGICLDRIKDSQEYEGLREIIIYNQIISLYLYVIITQKNFNLRYKLISAFIKKQKEFQIYKNKLIKANLNWYYKMLIKAIKFKLSYLINCMIEFKNIYKGTNKKIDDNKRLEDLVKCAKLQANLQEDKLKVSVVVPNYNYEKFLYSRLYSILAQNKKIYELIILDDCSKDNSRNLIDKMVESLEQYINIKKVYNNENSGSAFKQWAKGFELAEGDYVWIAEADDYCDKKLLKSLLKPVYKNRQVYISYVDTSFIDSIGQVFYKSVKPEVDIRKSKHWNKNYINKGINEIKEYAFLNCTIANVSSCVIKNDNYDDIFKDVSKYTQCGDWMFYLSVMEKGDIAYINKHLNYYRIHGDNITSTTKKQKHLEEIEEIHNRIIKKFNLGEWHKEEVKKRQEFLKNIWELKDE